jgi:predicted phage terminase large subunit-like protein
LPEKIGLEAFTKYLGYNNAPFHNDWYTILQPENNLEHFSPLKFHPKALKKYHVEWPRGHAKTETTSINYVSWLVGNYSNIHINIVSKTASLAESILTALMTRFEVDEKYKDVFGELKPADPRKWTSQQIIVNRTEISKNPTIKATGLFGPITGGRSDLVICDDIIDEENVGSHLQIEKVDTWFNKVLYPTLYPWGGVIVIGTRWHYADIYAHFLETWPNSVLKAIQHDGSVLWPEYWSLEKLEERRDAIGTIFFNCQYQNDPTGMEGELLKSSWLHDWENLPTSNCTYYAGVDPSLGEGDYFGIATLAYDRTINQAYLVDVWAEHMPFPTILKTKLPLLHSQYRYAKMYMETNFWQKLLMQMPELHGYPIVPIQTVKDKESRFIPMSSHFESKRVLVNPLINNQKSEFWLEWVQFPHGQHDDALDCVEMVVRNVVQTAQPAWILR